MIDRGAVTKSHKGKKAYERKVRDCYHWKATGQCSKETHAVSVMVKSSLEPVAKIRDEKDIRPLPHVIRRQSLTERENAQKHRATEMKALQIKGARFHVDGEIVPIRHLVIGILPYVRTAELRLDAHMVTNAIFDMTRRMRSPATSQRKGVRKDQLFC